MATIAFPCGALSLTSGLYIERPPLEASCYENLQISGSLTRIKGPRHMGKSSLLVRLLAQAHRLNYRTVSIDFQSAEQAVYQDISRFLRWFCCVCARALQLPPCLDEYWDEEVGAKLSTTLYFEEYLLASTEQPVVLALNEVNRVFEHAQIACDFLPLLRVWYEQARQSDDGTQTEVGFQKLRMIVVHSTDVYVSLNVHQSPFNVGLPVRLKPFNDEQIQQLAQRYGLTFGQAEDFRTITRLVGGHPYLLSIAFYYLSQGQLSLSQLVAEAPTPAGMYQHHLQTCLEIVQGQPKLAEAFGRVVMATDAVEIESAIAHQLSSLGLVILDGNACRLSCELYRLFFKKQGLSHATDLKFSDLESVDLNSVDLKSVDLNSVDLKPVDLNSVDLKPVDLNSVHLHRLQQENERLKILANVDGLTQVANRRLFEERSSDVWGAAMARRSVVSLIMLDIDFFKLYNDYYGHLAGDFCLKQIAKVLSDRIGRSTDTVARYGGEEFAVILPETPLEAATKIARQLRAGIRSLNITHEASKLADQIVTASIGVASGVPRQGQLFSELIAAADAALYVSKQQGRDRVNTSNALLTPPRLASRSVSHWASGGVDLPDDALLVADRQDHYHSHGCRDDGL